MVVPSGEIKLARGYRKRRLIHELAVGARKQEDLAEEYDCTRQAIAAFAKRYAEEIAAVKANIDEEFSGMWIADKKERVAEYQQDVEDINKYLDSADGPDGELMRIKHGALRAVSEELGQLPARVHVSVQADKLNYTVAGVDVEQLK